MFNIPNVKLGIIAVSRDCFPIGLSISRREAIVKAYGEFAGGQQEVEKDAHRGGQGSVGAAGGGRMGGVGGFDEQLDEK